MWVETHKRVWRSIGGSSELKAVPAVVEGPRTEALYQRDGAKSREDDVVGPAWRAGLMNAVTEAARVRSLAYQKLGLRVLSAYPGHHSGAGSRNYNFSQRGLPGVVAPR